MPDFRDFMTQLEQAGITVTDEAKAHAWAKQAGDNWPQAVMQMAMQGRHLGIRFIRTGDKVPTSDELHSILRGYPFPHAANFIGNIDLSDPDEPTHDQVRANLAGYEAGIEGAAAENPHPAGSKVAKAYDAGLEQGRSVRREIQVSDCRG